MNATPTPLPPQKPPSASTSPPVIVSLHSTDGTTSSSPTFPHGFPAGASFPHQSLWLMFEEITASSLVKIDMNGEKVGARPTRQSRRLHHPFRGA